MGLDHELEEGLDYDVQRKYLAGCQLKQRHSKRTIEVETTERKAQN
jgi:hypothetical protein